MNCETHTKLRLGISASSCFADFGISVGVGMGTPSSSPVAAAAPSGAAAATSAGELSFACFFSFLSSSPPNDAASAPLGAVSCRNLLRYEKCVNLFR